MAVKNVVLVHGAWADGSSWSKVIPLLQHKGLHAVAVQNPLSSIDDDLASTKRPLGKIDKTRGARQGERNGDRVQLSLSDDRLAAEICCDTPPVS